MIGCYYCGINSPAFVYLKGRNVDDNKFRTESEKVNVDMSITEKLARIKPTENAGPRASNRFEYQINWGLNLLLKMEEKNEDYIMILDYYDDIVVCNSDSNSEYIDFYQVKTKASGLWTMGGLTGCSVGDNNLKTPESQTEVSEGLSIIAKLINHVNKFEDCRKLYFVTNSSLTQTIYGASDEKVIFEMLKSSAKKAIKEKIQKELGHIDDDVFEKLVFIQNQMNIGDYEQTMLGKISQFLKSKFNLVTDSAIVYETLIGELRKRNRYEPIIQNQEELLKYKAISHKEFCDYLETLTLQKGFNELRKDIFSMIDNYIKFFERDKITRSLKDIYRDLMNYENDELLNLVSEIKNAMSSNQVSCECESLWDYSNSIYNVVMQTYNNYKLHDEFYIKALILYTYARDKQSIL